jgi:hypothetical protein
MKALEKFKAWARSASFSTRGNSDSRPQNSSVSLQENAAPAESSAVGSQQAGHRPETGAPPRQRASAVQPVSAKPRLSKVHINEISTWQCFSMVCLKEQEERLCR